MTIPTIAKLFACAACAFSTGAFAQMSDAMPPPQTMPPPMQVAMSTNAPLTRAEVRADLARARADGTIPRYGNPDPYGPARSARGAPGMYPRS